MVRVNGIGSALNRQSRHSQWERKLWVVNNEAEDCVERNPLRWFGHTDRECNGELTKGRAEGMCL